ncbi:hypothetical protein [Streptomyces sp. NPDC020965]|uniref:hypothetical protein n=1 Tax=Streptomyces sp. NPDC020965 TaxID=3365105 RepID=UPI003796AAE6
MSLDDIEDTQEPVLSLGDAALLSAFAKLYKERIVPEIDVKIGGVKGPLLTAYDDPDRSTKSIDVKVGGIPVATHTVAISQDKFDVGDEDAFTAFAEEHDEIEVIIRARPAFRAATLKRAKYDKATNSIVDKRSGEVIPGITRTPGGQPTGTVTLTWKEGGQETLMEAFRKGQLDSLLRGVPMLPAQQGRDAEQQ